MSKPEQINRVISDPDALDFATLRKDAIALVQELCGELWTDYNLHDPGVTILEQLCYGLTDLAYRTDFAIEDYLTGKTDTIEYEKLALYPPHEILPSSAVTESDYQKILYGALPALNNIWIKPCINDDVVPGGLYDVFVELDQDLGESGTEPAFTAENSKKIADLKKNFMDSLVRQQAIFSQTGDNLVSRREILQAWLRQVKEQTLVERIEQLITQSEVILQRLNTLSSKLGHIRDQLDADQSVLSEQTTRPSGTEPLEKILTKLLWLCRDPFSIAEFGRLLTRFDFSFKNLPDFIPIFKYILAKLIAYLNKFSVVLNEQEKHLAAAQELLPDVDENAERETEIKKNILRFFAANRTLCEDIHRIHFIKTTPYFLTGKIAVLASYDPAKIYGEIFFRCARYISSNIQMEHYGTVLSGNKNYEQIFSGPLTEHGYISDESFTKTRNFVTIVDLITLINDVDGVDQVHELILKDKEGREYSSLSCKPSQQTFPSLCFPEADQPDHILQLLLPQNNHVIREPVSQQLHKGTNTKLLAETRREVERMLFKQRAFRRNTQPLNIPVPAGQQLNLQEYYSIQNHFPAIYGINRYGIPKSKAPEAHARAKQLKAYLYPFEQLMANYLQGLQSIPELFSINPELKRTYFHQYLDDSGIPDIETLYTKNSTKPPLNIAAILARYDDYGERRNRILDVILAIFGEQYERQSLLRFNYYRQADPDAWIIENKINYLRYIREISRDRAKGFNYLLPPAQDLQQIGQQENFTGLYLKISFLLGLKLIHPTQSITDVLIRRNSRISEADADDKLDGKMEFIAAETSGEAVPAIDESERKPPEITMPSVLSPALFRQGIELVNYRLVQSGEETVVCFRLNVDSRLFPLVKKSSFDEAAVYAHQHRNTLLQMNTDCESFFILEHILLRPRSEGTGDKALINATFFNFRVSIIFPSWTARFSDPAFRKFAQETIQENLPAHVFADFFWLDFADMQAFEKRHKEWLEAMQQIGEKENGLSVPQLDQASEKLVRFLSKNKQKEGCEYWL